MFYNNNQVRIKCLEIDGFINSVYHERIIKEDYYGREYVEEEEWYIHTNAGIFTNRRKGMEEIQG